MAPSKVQPTHYPRIPFHLLRSAQLTSSLVVASVMLYFIANLSHDGYAVPWTFILLTTVSFLTIVFLGATIVLHCCYGLNPRLNIALNTSLLAIWTVGFALLAWWSSPTLGHVCSKLTWHNEDGIMICRIYKALFAFSLLGFLSTISALALDLYVWKQSIRRGKYNQMQELDLKQDNRTTNDPNQGLSGEQQEYAQRRPFGFQPTPKSPGQAGYAHPEEQFDYDTGYQGPHVDGMMRRHEEALM